MIARVDERMLPEIFDYIGTEYHAGLYLYIDIQKYGLAHPHMQVWCERDDAGALRLVVMQYYTGMVLFSRAGGYDAPAVAALLARQSPSIISGMQRTLAPLHALLPAYSSEEGTVAEIKQVSLPRDPAVLRATPAEMREVAGLLMQDPGFGEHSTLETLAAQLTERLNEGFGRSYVLRQNGNIVAHAASYAELPNLAVVSGVVTHPAYRGQGLMKRVYSALCADLLSEGKRVYACYFVPAAIQLHHRIGFADLGIWEKLVKNQ